MIGLKRGSWQVPTKVSRVEAGIQMVGIVEGRLNALDVNYRPLDGPAGRKRAKDAWDEDEE